MACYLAVDFNQMLMYRPWLSYRSATTSTWAGTQTVGLIACTWWRSCANARKASTARPSTSAASTTTSTRKNAWRWTNEYSSTPWVQVVWNTPRRLLSNLKLSIGHFSGVMGRITPCVRTHVRTLKHGCHFLYNFLADFLPLMAPHKGNRQSPRWAYLDYLFAD